MKKFKILSITAILNVALLTSLAFAQINMSVSDAEGRPDDTGIEVRVSLSETSSLSFRPWGIEFLLVYDANKLTIPPTGGVSVTGLTAGWLVTYDTSPQNLPSGKDGVQINLIGSSGLSAGAGDIAKIFFNVVSGALDGTFALSITSAALTDGVDVYNTLDFNDGAFTIDTEGPSLTIISPAGDITDPTPILDYDTDGTVTEVMVDTNIVTTRDGEELEELADGSYTVYVTAEDTLGNTTTVSSTFTIEIANNPPQITSRLPDVDMLTINLTEGGTLQFAITATDDPGDTLTYEWKLDGDVLAGKAASDLDAATYVAALSAGQSYPLVVTVIDNGGLSASNTWTLNIILNYPPVALDDRAVTDADTAVDISVLANDRDPDEDPLIVESVTQPADGTAEIIENNTKVRYTPGADFGDGDSFSYIVADGNGGTDQATVTVYSRSVCPWPIDVDPDYQFSYPIYGTAMQRDQAGQFAHLAEGDWIGVFDADGNCYGAGQYEYNLTEEYLLSVYAKSVIHGLEGFESGEKMHFRFYLVGVGEFSAISVETVDDQLQTVPRYYPEYEDGDLSYPGDPVEINLVTADEQELILKPGWNFISFYIQPDSTKLEDAFSSILTGDNDYLEYVASHDKFWWKTIAAGSLTDVDAYHSYYLKTSEACPPEGCVLRITGLRVELPHSFELTQGWSNISYLLDYDTYAIYDLDTEADTGIFSGIKDSIVWIKGPDGKWAMPGHGALLLKPAKGLFLKMYSDVTFAYED